MNPIVQFKYKKPQKIHHSNFYIFTENEFFCLNGCMTLHNWGEQKINLQCVEYFIKHKPIDLKILYIGCLEELVQYIIYSGVMNSFIKKKNHVMHTKKDYLNYCIESNVSNEEDFDCFNYDSDFTDQQGIKIIEDISTDGDNDDGNNEDDMDRWENITHNSEGYYSSSLTSDDEDDDKINNEKYYNADDANLELISNEGCNSDNNETTQNNNITLARFLTDENIELRQSILDSILDENQIDYLDCGAICFDVDVDVENHNNDGCEGRLCYYHKLNLNSLFIIKALHKEELINNYKINFLNKI